MICLLPMGDRAVIVAGMPDPAAWANELKRQWRQGSDPCFTIPAAETVLVVYESPEALARQTPILLTTHPSPAVASADASPIDIPVIYDGDDLESVARAVGLSTKQVIALHSEARYSVAFCGFAPGFAYLRGLPSQLRIPRRPSPRTAVPAGSVAIADEYSAVYPRSLPGGWHVLGTTSMTLFDASAPNPAALKSGDSVRFRPVDSLPVDSRTQTLARIRSVARSDGAITVTSVGVATSIQDAGRGGHSDLGVPPAGSVDPMLAATINRFVGNPPQAALIETCGGLTLRAQRPVTVATSETVAPVALGVGDSISVVGGGGRRWHYLAVRGGLQVGQFLGSSSTDTLSGLGPSPIVAGDCFAVGPDPDGAVTDASPIAYMTGAVRISRGPRLDWFAADTFETLSGSSCVVREISRIGVRLTGPRLVRVRHDELPSEGLIRGALQATPSGELVMMLADHPTTGGYPVVAVVHADDVAKVAQLDSFTFR